jgi:hypothetical protein
MPSYNNDIMQNTRAALALVFQRPKYVVIALGAAVVFSIFVGSITNFSALAFTLRYSGWWSVPGSLVQIVWMNSTPWSLLLLFITALLVGINIAFIAFHVKRRLRATGFTSIAGIVLAVLGVGCASCGSVVLSSLIGLTAATSLLSVLPLRGTEFSLIAIGILLVSIVRTSKKIIAPLTCAANVVKNK